MIDRHYDKVIIFCYPAQAGGNFLINCLSLNDQCVLRNSKLAERQLQSGFTPADKIDYFTTQLNTALAAKKWNDLGLGCSNLFGVDNSIYLNEYPEIIQKKFNYIIPQLIRNSKYLFIAPHTTQYLNAYCNFWTNARTIFLTDYHKFVNNRVKKLPTTNSQLIQYWNNVKGPDWPQDPPTSYFEFLQLTDTIQDELTKNFHGEIFRWVDSPPYKQDLHDLTVGQYLQSMGNQCFDWNVANTYSGNESDFFLDLQKCAAWAGLTIDVPESMVIDYYRSWLGVISTIKS